mgnify:CR=1 FL=1
MVGLIIEKGYLISQERVCNPLNIKSSIFMQYLYQVICKQ